MHLVLRRTECLLDRGRQISPLQSLTVFPSALVPGPRDNSHLAQLRFQAKAMQKPGSVRGDVYSGPDLCHFTGLLEDVYFEASASELKRG
jgi:hypothetical protein